MSASARLRKLAGRESDPPGSGCIKVAVNHLRDLVIDVEALEKERDKMVEARKVLRDIEWQGGVRVNYEEIARCCPCCGGISPDEKDMNAVHEVGHKRHGHQAGCSLRALLSSPAAPACKVCGGDPDWGENYDDEQPSCRGNCNRTKCNRYKPCPRCGKAE